jgi:hypothetical protein
MRTLERLDEPISTPIKSHIDWHEETHKTRAHPRKGHVGPRDAMVDECMGFFGHTRPVKGCIGSFGCDGLRRGATHPKDMTICEGDIWSPYKSTREHNQERKKEKGDIERKSSD